MKCFVFAAGIGSRLKPWTLNHPKALAPVNGKPLLQWNIEKLKGLKPLQIIVNAHHFANQIEEFLTENYATDPTIVVSDERAELLDTGGGLLKGCATFGMNDNILVHNADILTDINLEDFIRRHIDQGNDVSLVVMPRETSRKLIFNEENRLVGWKNSATDEVIPARLTIPENFKELAFGGIHLLSPSALRLLEKYKDEKGSPAFSIIHFYLWAMDKIKIGGYEAPMPYRWLDVGKPETLEQAQTLFAQ